MNDFTMLELTFHLYKVFPHIFYAGSLKIEEEKDTFELVIITDKLNLPVKKRISPFLGTWLFDYLDTTRFKGLDIAITTTK